MVKMNTLAHVTEYALHPETRDPWCQGGPLNSADYWMEASDTEHDTGKILS